MTSKHAAGNNDTTEAGATTPGAVEPDRMTELEEALRTAEEQAAKNRDGYLRVAAELDNLHKRSVRELENAHKYALERFLRELLPVKDSLEAGLAVATADAGELREGQEMTLKLLNTALQRFGVRELSPAPGEDFNPDLHEAMTLQPSATAPPGSVLQTVQKGYLLEDRLLRPARVIVAKPPDLAA